jgi:hypothetical protein
MNGIPLQPPLSPKLDAATRDSIIAMWNTLTNYLRSAQTVTGTNAERLALPLQPADGSSWLETDTNNFYVSDGTIWHLTT